jgi:hypothetical protein
MDADVVDRYVALGLRLGRHVDGLVDAYYGPAELSERIASEPISPAGDLAREAAELTGAVATMGDTRRARWLLAQLDGLAATAERLDGRSVGYTEEIRRCYGATPEAIHYDELYEVHRRLAAVLPGAGPLRERYQGWRKKHELPREAVLPALQLVGREIRARTRTRFGLPEGESVEYELVTDQPWSGFNYYLGGLRSRVVINTDVPTQTQFLVDAAAHETYPGHHTEHAWKEALLVRGQNHREESIFLIPTPQSLIAEGIATNALTALGSDAEEACAAILEEMGWSYELDLSRAIRKIMRPMDQAWTTVALMVHEQRKGIDEARAFADRWVLNTNEEIEKRIEFILHPTWRAYVALYDIAERLVEKWTGGEPSLYKRLLTEQMTTADLSQPG